MTKHNNKLFILLVVFLCGIVTEAYSTAGFAEWEIPTPLGHEINHGDPYIEVYGTSIRPAGSTEDLPPFVQRLEEWTFYPGYVTGQAEQGYFIFDETSQKVDFFEDSASQKKAMGSLGLENPISRPYTNEKGWKEVWTQITNPAISSYDELLDRTLAEIEQQEYFQKLPAEQKEYQRQSVRRMIEANAAFLKEERLFLEKVLSELEHYPEYMKLSTTHQQEIREYLKNRLTATGKY